MIKMINGLENSLLTVSVRASDSFAGGYFHMQPLCARGRIDQNGKERGCSLRPLAARLVLGADPGGASVFTGVV